MISEGKILEYDDRLDYEKVVNETYLAWVKRETEERIITRNELEEMISTTPIVVQSERVNILDIDADKVNTPVLGIFGFVSGTDLVGINYQKKFDCAIDKCFAEAEKRFREQTEPYDLLVEKREVIVVDDTKTPTWVFYGIGAVGIKWQNGGDKSDA